MDSDAYDNWATLSLLQCACPVHIRSSLMMDLKSVTLGHLLDVLIGTILTDDIEFEISNFIKTVPYSFLCKNSFFTPSFNSRSFPLLEI